MRRFLICLIALLVTVPAHAQIEPAQLQRDFETALISEVDQVGDTKQLTSAQKKEAWLALEDRLIPKLGVKPWAITLKVEDVDPVPKTDKFHDVTFSSAIDFFGKKCTWKMSSNKLRLPIDKATAAKIHKGDYMDFSGVPLKLDSDASATKKAEYTRRIGRGLAFPVTITYENVASFTVVIVEAKYTLPK